MANGLPGNLTLGPTGAVQGSYSYNSDPYDKFRQLENLSRIAQAVAGGKMEKRARKIEAMREDVKLWADAIEAGNLDPNIALQRLESSPLKKVSPSEYQTYKEMFKGMMPGYDLKIREVANKTAEQDWQAAGLGARAQFQQGLDSLPMSFPMMGNPMGGGGALPQPIQWDQSIAAQTALNQMPPGDRALVPGAVLKQAGVPAPVGGILGQLKSLDPDKRKVARIAGGLEPRAKDPWDKDIAEKRLKLQEERLVFEKQRFGARNEPDPKKAKPAFTKPPQRIKESIKKALAEAKNVLRRGDMAEAESMKDNLLDLEANLEDTLNYMVEKEGMSRAQAIKKVMDTIDELVGADPGGLVLK